MISDQEMKVKVGVVARLLNTTEDHIYQILGAGRDQEKILQRIRGAVNVKKAREIYNTTPSHSEANRRALAKWEELTLKMTQEAATIEEIIEAYTTAPLIGEAGRLALAKWVDLCSTIEEAKRAYRAISVGTKSYRPALMRWLSLCYTIEDVKEAYVTISPDEEDRELVLAKWEELALKMIQEAKTVEEVTAVYDNLPSSGSKADRWAIEKLFQLV